MARRVDVGSACVDIRQSRKTGVLVYLLAGRAGLSYGDESLVLKPQVTVTCTCYV